MKAKLFYVMTALVIAVALVAVAAPLASPVQASSSWWDPAWEYRQKLTFDNSGQGENLVDFPVLVKLDSTRINYSKTQNSGQDIRFVDSDDSTVLKYEIEKWDENGVSWVWVKVPRIDGSSNDDYIYMYYGNPSAPDGQNPTAVWDSHYKGVWHLNRVSGSVLDSTTNDNDGTNSGSIRGVSGKIDDAFSFDGADDYVEAPDSSSLDITAVVTIEAWVNPAEFTNEFPGIAGKWDWSPTNEQRSYSLYLATYKYTFFMISANGSYQAELLSPTELATSTWYHLTGVSTGSKWIVYINGQMDCEKDFTTSIHSGTAKFSIGASMQDGSVATKETFEGAIDEVRVSDTVRSADWIKAQYLSMTDKFITYRSAEPAPTLPTPPPGCGEYTTEGSPVYACSGGAVFKFDHVDIAGTTTAQRTGENPEGPIPSGFRVVEQFWEVETTATSTAVISVSFPYDPSRVGNEASLKLFHWTGTSWEDVTTYVVTANHIIYGQVSSLSPFVMGEPVGEPGPAEEEDESCFIATAAYGTPTAEQLDVLRAFRDQVLLESSLGSQLVSLYYDFSPPLAEFISEHSLLRALVRELVIEPMVNLAELTQGIWGD